MKANVNDIDGAITRLRSIDGLPFHLRIRAPIDIAISMTANDIGFGSTANNSAIFELICFKLKVCACCRQY